MKKVLAISGSLRSNSTSLKIINLLAGLELFEIEIFDGIDILPRFSPDHSDNVPKEEIYFRKKLKEADGVLISSPEYVFAIPGSLKNALYWTASPGMK